MINFVLGAISVTLIIFALIVEFLVIIELAEYLGYNIPDKIKRLKR